MISRSLLRKVDLLMYIKTLRADRYAFNSYISILQNIFAKCINYDICVDEILFYSIL